MQIALKKKEVLPLLYCILTSIYYTLKGWKYENQFSEIFLYIAVLSALLYILKSVRDSWKYIFFLLPFTILVLYRMWLGGDTRLIISIFAIYIGKNLSYEKITKWLFISKMFMFVFAFIFGGYVHRNYLSINIGVLTFLLLLMYYPKNKKKAYILASLLFVFGVIISKSGSMIICGGIGLLLYLFLDTKFEQKILESKIICFIFPIALFLNWLLVVLYAAYGYNDSNFYFIKNFVPYALSSKINIFLIWLNKFVSGRINLAAFSLRKFGVSLLGGNIDYTVNTGLPYFLVDSGMMLLLQDWGIILTIAVMILFVFLMWRLMKNRQYQLIISGIVIALWAMNEDTLLSLGTNYLFFVIGNQFYKDQKI